MRTFHTGGAAGEDITAGLPRVEEIFEARTPKKPAILSELAGAVSIKKSDDNIILNISGKGEVREEVTLLSGYNFIVENGGNAVKNQTIAESTESDKKPLRSTISGVITIINSKATIVGEGTTEREYIIPKNSQLLVKNGDHVIKGQALTEGHYDLAASLKLNGTAKTQSYIIKQVQTIYESQGQDINDKHVEVIVKMMHSKVKVLDAGDSKYLPGQILSRIDVASENKELASAGKKQIKFEDLILGITRVALKTDSFLSAASFQETTSILIDAAISGKIDYLRGLKENVIIGKLIPAGTGFRKGEESSDEV
jgi:DNA-directed RNA polymerase subunit beta'